MFLLEPQAEIFDNREHLLFKSCVMVLSMLVLIALSSVKHYSAQEIPGLEC